MHATRSSLGSLICCCLLFLPAKAVATDYAVAAISPAMLKNADVVKREETTRLTVRSLHNVGYYHRYVLTILNEKGDKYAAAQEYYNKQHSIDYIRGTLYDADGKELKTLNKSDISEYSGTDEGTFANDYRIRRHSFYCKSYPYTVAYEVEQTWSYSMSFPEWQPVEGERMSVMQSTLEVSLPKDYDIRYRAFAYEGDPVITTASGKQITWEVKDLPALEKEYATPYWSELTPTVWLAPTNFRLQDYEGSMNTWQDFGRFVYSLYKGRDELPDATKEAVHQLTDNSGSTKEKIAQLYRYLQENTRYVSIQLGIGGWQPYDAAYVAGRKYGDCKALVNFMHALLKEAGIASCYALVNAGSNNKFFVPDFPSSRFNHIILAVPLAKDTVWLECTSRILPPGYLGSFTSDRYALMVNEQGGALVHTPAYGISDNRQLRHVESTVDTAGDLSIQVVTRYSGLMQDELSHELHSRANEKLLGWINESRLSLPDYKVTQYSYNEDHTAPPGITETMQVAARSYAQVSGKRLFINPNLLSQMSLRLPENEARKYAVVLANASAAVDTVIIHLPPGYTAESLPPPVMLGTAFGHYSASMRLSGNTLCYCRKLERLSGRFSAKEYSGLVRFYNQIYKADRAKAVLVKI